MTKQKIKIHRINSDTVEITHLTRGIMGREVEITYECPDWAAPFMVEGIKKKYRADLLPRNQNEGMN